MSTISHEQTSRVERLVATITEQATRYVKLSKGTRNADNQECHQHIVDVQASANEIRKTCSELTSLIQGPDQVVTSGETEVLKTAFAYTRSVALSLAMDMDLPGLITQDRDTTSLDDLVRGTGASKKLLKNVLRICADSSIFKEVSPETYAHTDLSRLLTDENGYLRTYSGYIADDGLRAGAFLAETLREQAFQPPHDRTKSAFCRAFGTSDPYQYYHVSDLGRGTRFDRAMVGNHSTHHQSHPIDMFMPFDKLPYGAVVVDIGGGRGQNALRLAANHLNLTVIVQDHESVVVAAEQEADIPSSVEGRVFWQPHDYFTPQPVEDADVYILSNVLMDNPDSDCKRILSCLATAMTPGKSKIVICDKLERETGSIYQNLAQLHILSCFNSWPRTTQEWKLLIADSVEGFTVDRYWDIGSGILLEVGLNKVLGE